MKININKIRWYHELFRPKQGQIARFSFISRKVQKAFDIGIKDAKLRISFGYLKIKGGKRRCKSKFHKLKKRL